MFPTGFSLILLVGLVVKIANNYSDPQTLDYGLPQGSCVGPQMFSYYTHPLSDINNNNNNMWTYIAHVSTN